MTTAVRRIFLEQQQNVAQPLPERKKATPDLRNEPGMALAIVMRREFSSGGCTSCYAPAARKMTDHGVLWALDNAETLGNEIYANALSRPDQNKRLIQAVRSDRMLLSRLVTEAADLASYGTDIKRDERFAEPATFVWLYYLDASDSQPKGEELRLSMRSVVANYIGDVSFVVVGDRPEWYDGPFIRLPRVKPTFRHRYRDTLNKMFTACHSDIVPERFVWMMDDQYFCHPVTMSDLEANWHRGPIPPKAWGNEEWREMQSDAYAALGSRGLKRIDFCTHLPKTVEKSKFIGVWDKYGLGKWPMAWELLYGSEYYETYRQVDSRFLQFVRRPTSQIPNAAIVNNGSGGWGPAFHRALLRKFSEPTEHEKEQYRFELPIGYEENPENNDGVAVPDDAQRNVYEYASRLPAETVYDLGTGSGSKLVEFFQCETIGVDVEEKVLAARQRFPEHRWETDAPIDCDLLLCVDVLEHLDDPREMLATIKAGKWKQCVISTPERDRVRGKGSLGPPKNPRHVREWNMGEFVRLITKFVQPVADVQVLGKYNLVVRLERE